ncbi:MAG: VCBS repeat-containing protein [Deltaproteobacteria bacterium]
MPNWRGQYERRALEQLSQIRLQGWRLGSLFLAIGALGMVVAACAETAGVPVVEGTGPGAGTVSATSEARCGAGGIECPVGGNGCCPAGDACTPSGTCVPAASCTGNQDCGSDSVCGGGTCKPWSSFPTQAAFDLSCRNGVDLPSLQPQVQCRWGDTPPREFPNSVQVIGTPMVIDFNYDNNPTTIHPSIVFVSYEAGGLATPNGVLRVINGLNCLPEFSADGGDNPFVPDITPALGDIDGDGRPDIVLADIQRNGTSTKTGVVVYSTKGAAAAFARLSRQTASATTEFKGISLFDVDALEDNLPEILTDTGMFSFKNGMTGGISGLAQRVPLDGSLLEPPFVHDVDGDRSSELVTAQGIFSWNDAASNMDRKKARAEDLWNADADQPNAAFVGMANLGDFQTVLGEDSAEMVVISNGELRVTQVDGRVLMKVKGSGIVGGPPVIADFDADGRMEFASPGLDQITAFDLDCYDDETAKGDPRNCKNPDGPNPEGILWRKTGARGATSGASVFDFDGDRRSEVVYADQCFMRIMSGSSGDVLFSVPRSSTTRFDYPVIADVDGDGHTEIVTGSNDDNTTLNCPLSDPLNTRATVRFAATHGVTVWSDAITSAEKRWAGSRPIWNQYTYSITNVNDDGTIPSMREVASQFNSPETDPNSLRQNVQGKTGISLELPDITVSGNPVVSCLMNQAVAKVSLNLCNRGLLELPEGKVRVALAQANNSRVLCDRPNTSVLRSGKCEVVTCDVPVPNQNPGIDIAVLADPSSAVRECTKGKNNTSLVSNVFCQAVPR